MRKNDRKIFLNKARLYQLLNLRILGLSQNSLAALFNCDRTSIRHNLQKYKIEKPEITYSLGDIVGQVLPKPQEPTFKIVNGERINLGRNYRDYIPIAKITH